MTVVINSTFGLLLTLLTMYLKCVLYSHVKFRNEIILMIMHYALNMEMCSD